MSDPRRTSMRVPAWTVVATALSMSVAACAAPAAPVAAEPRVTITADAPVPTEHNATDTEFAQMMVVHHEGAVAMADIAVDRATSAQVQELATRIRVAQAPEIAILESWLAAWDEAAAADAAHGGMDHAAMSLDGIDQAQALEDLEGVDAGEFDALFLRLMIAHHEGAVAMAAQELASGVNPSAHDMAQAIVRDQEAEIDLMRALMEESAL